MNYAYLINGNVRSRVNSMVPLTEDELEHYKTTEETGGVWKLQTQEERIDEDGNVIQAGVYQDIS